MIFKKTIKSVLSQKTVFDQSPLTSSTPAAINLQLASPASELANSPSPQPSKTSYIIALFGDSMVDTMGDDLPYLQESLKSRYPQTSFKLFNYGIGGQNVAQGLARFAESYAYQNRNYPPLPQINPDIIIVASFAYNPFSPHDRDRHWLTLTELVNKAKSTRADVYVLAEIAPLNSGFGKGPNGINWPPDVASTQAAHIVEQLENAVALAQHLDVPLINAFEKTQVFGRYGSSEYTDQNDGIHPSVIGHQFMADLIARTIILP